MTKTVFLKENQRELVVYNEKINLKNLEEIFALAKTADPALDKSVRDKKKAYPPHEFAVTAIKFHSCEFEMEDFKANTPAIIEQIKQADKILGLSFSGNCNIDVGIAKKILKILLFVTSRTVAIDFEALNISNVILKNSLQMMALYNTEWAKYFQTLWEVRWQGDIDATLTRKLKIYNELVRDISVWRFEFHLANAVLASYTAQRMDRQIQIVVPQGVVNEEFSPWYERATKLIKRIKGLLDEFGNAESKDEKSVVVLLHDLLGEITDLVVKVRDPDISYEEQIIYSRYLKTRETFRGALQFAHMEERVRAKTVDHEELFSIYAKSCNRRSTHESVRLRILSLAVNSLLFNYAAKLNSEGKVEEAKKIYEGYCERGEVQLFLNQLEQLPLEKLSATTIYDIGLRLLVLFKVHYKRCMENYSEEDKAVASQCLFELNRLMAANPHNHASRFIYLLLEKFLRFKQCSTDDADKEQAFYELMSETIRGMISIAQGTHVVEYSEESVLRCDRIDRMSLTQLGYKVLKNRLALEELALQIKSQKLTAADKLTRFKNFLHLYRQFEQSVTNNIAQLKELLAKRDHALIDAFSIFETVPPLEANLQIQTSNLKKATLVMYGSFADWIEQDDYIDGNSNVRPVADSQQDIPATIDIYQQYKALLLTLDTNYQPNISFIDNVIALLQQMLAPPKLFEQSRIAFDVESIQLPLVPAAKPSLVSEKPVQMPEVLDNLFKAMQEAIPFSQPFAYGEFVTAAMVQVMHPNLNLTIPRRVKLVMFSVNWQGCDYDRLCELIPGLTQIDKLSQKYHSRLLDWDIEITVYHPSYFSKVEFIQRCYVDVNTLILTPNGRIWDHIGYAIESIGERLIRFLPNTHQFNHPLMLLEFIEAAVNYKFTTYQVEIERIRDCAASLLSLPPMRLFEHFFKLFQRGNTLSAFRWWLNTGVLDVMLPEVALMIRERPSLINAYEDFLTKIDAGDANMVLAPTILLADLIKLALIPQCNPMVHTVINWVNDRIYTSCSPLLAVVAPDKKFHLIRYLTDCILAGYFMPAVSNAQSTLYGSQGKAPVGITPQAPNPLSFAK